MIKILLKENKKTLFESKDCGNLKYCGIALSLRPCNQDKNPKESISKSAAFSLIAGLFAVFESGCGYYCDVEECSYKIEAEEDWLPETLKSAISFWESKGVYLTEETDDGAISIDVKDIDAPEAGVYEPDKATITLNSTSFDVVRFDFEMPKLNTKRRCTLAHEIGHSFGMQHNKNSGLMRDMYYEPSDTIVYSETDCPWSEEDQQQLEDILKNR